MSARNQSPVASRRSVVLPPDNYIPVLNADATISLPPPHELAMPLPTEAVRSDQRDDRLTYPEKGKQVPSTSYRIPMTPPSPTPRREPPDPERIVVPEVSFQVLPSKKFLLTLDQVHEPRSPATYSSRPPLRRREVVMPVPLGHIFTGENTATPSNQGSTENVYMHLRPVRTPSNNTIPGIEIETPVRFLPSQTFAFRVTYLIIFSLQNPHRPTKRLTILYS